MQAFVFAAVLAVAAAAPQEFEPQYTSQSYQPEVRLLGQSFYQDQQGNYEYSYEQDNGQRVQEVGQVSPGPQPETGSISQQGSYQFVADDGNTYQLSYIADEFGFQPRGAHLPVAPAQIPEYAQLKKEHPELFWAVDHSYTTSQ